MSASTPSPQARRADAERNREKILAAARTAFSEPGAAASLAEISRRAGVGMATLYRNFATRQDLLEALYVDEVNAVCETTATVDGQTPGEAFTTWLHRFVSFFTNKHPIASELLEHTDTSNPVFNDSRARVIAAGQPLLAAAQLSHEVRTDLTLEQILAMIIAVAKISADPDYVEPILRATLDGLRPV